MRAGLRCLKGAASPGPAPGRGAALTDGRSWRGRGEERGGGGDSEPPRSARLQPPVPQPPLRRGAAGPGPGPVPARSSPQGPGSAPRGAGSGARAGGRCRGPARVSPRRGKLGLAANVTPPGVSPQRVSPRSGVGPEAAWAPRGVVLLPGQLGGGGRDRPGLPRLGFGMERFSPSPVSGRCGGAAPRGRPGSPAARPGGDPRERNARCWPRAAPAAAAWRGQRLSASVGRAADTHR